MLLFSLFLGITGMYLDTYLKKDFCFDLLPISQEENRLTILKPQNFTSSSIRSQQDEHNAIFYPTH